MMNFSEYPIATDGIVKQN